MGPTDAPQTPPDGLPLTLAFEGREVLLVGAGPVSARRAQMFADAGADVRVVAPEVSDAMADVVDAAVARGLRIRVERRPVEASDLDTSWFVHVATGDPDTDAAVARDCEARRLWCVAAGEVDLGSARVPARAGVVTPAGSVRIAVDSDDPRRSADVGRRLARSLSTDPGGLRARRRRDHGWVALVAGVGDDDLLTVRGRRFLHAADVVVVDSGLSETLVAELDDDVEIIEFSEPFGAAAAALVAQRAAEGQGVVRIVDHGYLATEADVLRRGGAEVTVVPGVLPELA